MNYFVLYFLILSLGLSNCYQKNHKIERQNTTTVSVDLQKDKEEIKNLILEILRWSESNESIDLLPVLLDSKGSICIGFDMNKHNDNLAKLRETDFFANEFIENYNQIILTLDRKLRSKEFKEWLVGDLPPFKFVNDIDPWCLCQGFSSEQFDGVEIANIDNQSGELIWKWKNGTDWMNFKFMVSKEDDKWKVSYMQGFDYKEGIRIDGEILIN